MQEWRERGARREGRACVENAWLNSLAASDDDGYDDG
jgi:hypothetical protein